MGNTSFGKARNTVSAVKPTIQGEPRRAKRARTLLKGKLSYGHGAFTVDCVIRDFSHSGARVRVQPGVAIPANLYLVHLRNRTAFEATVKWRDDDGNLGLKLNAAHDLDHTDHAEMKVLRRYCIDSVCAELPPLKR